MQRSSSQQAKARRDCFHAHKRNDENGRVYLVCHICKSNIDPACEAWEAEHVLRKALESSDDPINVYPAHAKCHRTKTTEDNRETAKGKRVSDKHNGIRRKQGFSRVSGSKYNWETGRYER